MPYDRSLMLHRLEGLIEDRGWTNQQFAERIELHPSQLSKWKQQPPRLDGLIRLAEGLGVSVDYLCGYIPDGATSDQYDAGLIEATEWGMSREPKVLRRRRRRVLEPDEDESKNEAAARAVREATPGLVAEAKKRKTKKGKAS